MIEQGWKHNRKEQEYPPKSTNGSLGPRTTAAMPPINRPQAQEAAYPAGATAHLYPEFVNKRLGTPLNPASEVSQFISALDTESLHDNHNRRSDHISDAARSHHTAEERHDDRSSTSDRGEFD